jgi:hypothetical protein
MKAVSVESFNPELVEFLDRFGSPFTQSWFLDIAKGDGTLMVNYVDRGGEIVACLPIVLSRKYRIFLRGNAESWTHLNGPVIHPSLSREERAQAVSLLLNGLRWISCRFVCDPADFDAAVVEAFRTAGFKLRKQATYLRMPSDPDVLSELRKKHRNRIKRAARSFQIAEDTTAKEFIDTYLANLKAAGKDCYADPRLALELIEAGRRLTRVMIFAAKTNSCKTVAAIACLLNQHRMYYWLTTRRRFGDGDVLITGSQDAIKVLIVHAIRRAQELNLTFDADGVSNSRTADPFYERFFFHKVERCVFTRRSPHDPWGIKQFMKNFYFFDDIIRT